MHTLLLRIGEWENINLYSFVDEITNFFLFRLFVRMNCIRKPENLKWLSPKSLKKPVGEVRNGLESFQLQQSKYFKRFNCVGEILDLYQKFRAFHPFLKKGRLFNSDLIIKSFEMWRISNLFF